MTIEDFKDNIIEKLEVEAKKVRGDLNGIYTGLKLAIDIIEEEYENIPEIPEEEFVKRLNSHHEENYDGFYDDDCDELEEDCYDEDSDLDCLTDYPNDFNSEWKKIHIKDILPDNDEFRKRLIQYGYYTIADLMFDFNNKIQYNFVNFKGIKERVGTIYSTAYDWYTLYNELIKHHVTVTNKDIYNINYNAVVPAKEDRDISIISLLMKYDISPRMRNALYRVGFTSLADLKVMGPVGNLMNCKDIGKKTMMKIAVLIDKIKGE